MGAPRSAHPITSWRACADARAVFVLQHAQGRLTTATQLKLDELLRSLPQADDALIKAETAADEDLEQQAEQNIRLRDDVRARTRGEPGGDGRSPDPQRPGPGR